MLCVPNKNWICIPHFSTFVKIISNFANYVHTLVFMLQNNPNLAPATKRMYRNKDSSEIRDKYPSDSILHAAMMVLKEMGYANAAKVHKRLMDDPEGIGNLLANYLDKPPAPPVTKLKPMEALGFMMHHEESKFDMTSIKKISKACNADFLPCYDYISQAKKLCRPPRDQYFITETSAIVPLKALVIHTIDRILQIPRVEQDILERKRTEPNMSAKLTLKIGNDT